MIHTQFHPFPELATERLLLRQLHLSDVAEIFELRSNHEVLKFVGREPAKSKDEAKAFIKTVTESIKAGDAIMWGIALRNSPATIIGTIGYWQMQKEHFRSELGYALLPPYWGKGFAKEAIEKALDFGFKKIKLHSVEARIDPANKASAKVLLATGFEKEGYFKEDYYFKGKFLDTEVYSRRVK